MSVIQIASQIYSSQQAQILLALIVANVLAGIAAALQQGKFDLIRVGDWLLDHLVPLMLGYGAASFFAVADPSYAWLQSAAFLSVAATATGYLLNNLKELGIIRQPEPKGPATPTP